MSEFWTLSMASLKASLRSGGELFWNVLFLILLFFVFTSVSFEGSPPKVFIEGNIEIPEGFRIVQDRDKADAILELEGNTLKVEFRNPDEMVRMRIRSLVWELKEKIERKGRERAVVVETVKIGKEMDYKSFITTGIITMLIFSTGAFGSIKILSVYRYSGVLKIFKASPVNDWGVYMSLSFSAFVQAVLGVSVLLLLSKIRGVNLEIHPGGFVIAFLASFGISFGVGVALSLIFKTPRSAMGVASALYTLMPFFSGVYFPVEFLPSSIRWISNLMPMKYMVEMVRKSLGM